MFITRWNVRNWEEFSEGYHITQTPVQSLLLELWQIILAS